MENGKFVKLILICLFLSNPLLVKAYSDDTTHPALTDEIVDFFNHHYPERSIGEDEKKSIKKGSIEEDNPAAFRVTRHFYDPIHDTGLLSVFASSKDWASDPYLQGGGIINDLFGNPDDYSWERAIFDYVHGDKVRGLEGLGHILHLIEDATVPDHVRDDQHLSGVDYSPHERWTVKYIDKNITTAADLVAEGVRPALGKDIGSFFDKTALFTNQNFFSKDSIFIEKYAEPTIKDKRIEILKNGATAVFGLGKNNNNDFRLVKIHEKVLPSQSGFEKINSYTIEDDLIAEDYWQILSRHAVTNGAGVIKLFFDEVEKEKKTGALLAKNTNWIEKQAKQIASAIKATFGAEVGPALTKGNTETINMAGPDSMAEFSASQPDATSSFLPSALLSDEEIERLIGLYAPKGTDTAVLSKAVRKYVRSSDSVDEDVPEEPVPQSSLSLEIAQCDTSFVADACLSTGTVFSLAWTGAPLGTVRYSVTAIGTTLETADMNLDISVPENGAHPVVLRALDAEGGVLASASMTVSSFPRPIVINEVAWGGTDASSTDEWIELYNPTPYDIPLEGFSLAGFTGGSVDLSGTIGSKDRYLLERGSDGIISDVSADIVYDGSLEMSDDVGALMLVRNGITVDETPAGGWPAGTNFDGDRSSMERFSYQEFGADEASWNTNILIVQNGLDRDGNPVRGTPGKRNAANYLVMKDGQALPAGLVLDRSPYLTLNSLTVAEGTTFTIGEGVTLKMYGSDTGITVLGTLLAEGTAELPVVLTSFSDPAYGSDIGSSAFVDPEPTWGGITILDTSEGSHLSNVVVTASEDGIFVDDSDLMIIDSILEDNANGIIADASVVTIEDTEIVETVDPVSAYGGSVISIASSTIVAGEGSMQAATAYGGSTLTIASSTVSSETGDAIVAFDASEVTVATSTVSAGGSGTAITVFSNTSATIENAALQGGTIGSGAVVFSESNLTIASSTVVGGDGAAAVSVFADSVLHVASSTILAGEGGTGVEVFSNSAALIKASTISGEGSGTGIEVFQPSGGTSTVVVEDSSIAGFETGISALPDTEVTLVGSAVGANQMPISDGGGTVTEVAQ